MPTTALTIRLNSALHSREQRLIRRRLPDSSSPDSLVDFNSNDYLSLTHSPTLRSLFLSKLTSAPHILGSGGSRLLVNGPAHAALESRLARFFAAPSALLFNSGFDANVGLFSSLPQSGDAVLYDEYIHASVHDGVRASRARDAQFTFPHNSVPALRATVHRILRDRPTLLAGTTSLFVAVESLYSMDGTFAPLQDILDSLQELLPMGNAYLIVDEAHCTGIYGPQGRGMVAQLGLENRVFARLHTFGKALAGTGAVLLTSTLVRDYLLNYARSLIYTTSLSFPNVIAADCSFDLLENGQAQELADHLLYLSTYFISTFRPRIEHMPPDLLSLPPHLVDRTDIPFSPPPASEPLPSPIIPIMTAHPRALSAFLAHRGLNARSITWPTVPKGKDRVRVCLHAGNTRADVDRLVDAALAWANGMLAGAAVESKL